MTYFSNITMTYVGPEETIIHFALRNEIDPFKGTGIAKVYLTTAHAKRLMSALKKGLEQLEAIFGEVVEDPGAKLTADQLQKLQEEKPGK